MPSKVIASSLRSFDLKYKFSLQVTQNEYHKNIIETYKYYWEGWFVSLLFLKQKLSSIFSHWDRGIYGNLLLYRFTWHILPPRDLQDCIFVHQELHKWKLWFHYSKSCWQFLCLLQWTIHQRQISLLILAWDRIEWDPRHTMLSLLELRREFFSFTHLW